VRAGKKSRVAVDTTSVVQTFLGPRAEAPEIREKVTKDRFSISIPSDCAQVIRNRQAKNIRKLVPQRLG
jgi:hypothetical protein